MFCYGSRKRIGSTFRDVSQLEVVIVVVGNVLRPIEGVTARSQFALNFLLIWQRAGQEPEGNAGEEEEDGGHHEAHPPGAHPAGIFRSDAHTFLMPEKSIGVRSRKLMRV